MGSLLADDITYVLKIELDRLMDNELRVAPENNPSCSGKLVGSSRPTESA